MEGVIKFYNSQRGFGFITNPEGGKDIFVHRDDIPEGVELDEGDKVSFEVVEEDRGPKAKNIKKL